MPIDDIRIIAVRYADDKNNNFHVSGSDTLHYTDANDAEKMTIAILKLHLNPGINPYNNQPTAKLKFLAIQTPSLIDSYWWTSPDLKSGINGANIVNYWKTEIIYMSSEIYAQQLQCYDNEQTAEAFDAQGEPRPQIKPIETKSFIHENYQKYVNIEANNKAIVQLH